MRTAAASICRRTLQLGVCAAALWLVARTLHLHDTVTLRDGSVATGRVTLGGEALTIAGGDGGVRQVAIAEVAHDSRGALQIEFGLLSVWRGNRHGLLLAGVLVWLIVPILQALRLHVLLRSQHVGMPWGASIRLAFAGNFLNYAAPLGSTAGDVYKAWYAAQRTTRRTEAAAVVLLDRAIGLFTLLLTVGVIALLSPAESRLAPLRAWLLTLSVAPLIGLLIYLAPGFRGSSLLRRLAARLPQRDRIRRIDATARALLGSPAALLTAVGVTLVLQVLCALSFACVAASVGLAVSGGAALDTYAYFSAGEIVKAIPGPPQGLGTVELAYCYFFDGLGGAAQIISAALLIRLVGLVCALPGVITAVGGLRAMAAQRPAPGTAGGTGERLGRPAVMA